MHFSVPDTTELTDSKGSSFVVFNLHINGVFHCAVRYRQLHEFQLQLKKEFGANIFPPFPPKRLLPLTPAQVDERRLDFEHFIQQVSQIAHVANSSTFNGFLLNAQQESQHETPEEVALDVFLVNGHKITVRILSTDQTEDVLESVASQIDLADQYVYYFGLFLVAKSSGVDSTLVRKLQDFESPYISLKAANATGTHWIILRKSYWDTTYDDDLVDDRVAMNLLYVQAVHDVERGWITPTNEQSSRLMSLQQRGSKKEYLRFVRTLKYYGHVVFSPCTTDFTDPRSNVVVAAGNKELNFRIQVKNDVKEVGFKVTRMRCWRISSMIPESNGDVVCRPDSSHLELAFEYLVAKNTLKWVTLYSNQAILISMCLQGMVDELIMKKEGNKIKRPQDRNKQRTSKNHVARESTGSSSKPPTTPTEKEFGSLPTSPVSDKPTSQPRRLSERLSSVSVRGGSQRQAPTVTENDAFDGIRDDDL